MMLPVASKLKIVYADAFYCVIIKCEYCCVSWIVRTNCLELYHGYSLRINLHTRSHIQKNMTWLYFYT